MDKSQCWGNRKPRIRFLLNQGHLSQNHSRASSTCSATVSLLVESRATVLEPPILPVGPGSSHEETSQDWQDPKVWVAASGRVLIWYGHRTLVEKSGSLRVPKWLQNCLPCSLKHGLCRNICVPTVHWSLSCQATKELSHPNASELTVEQSWISRKM